MFLGEMLFGKSTSPDPSAKTFTKEGVAVRHSLRNKRLSQELPEGGSFYMRMGVPSQEAAVSGRAFSARMVWRETP